MGTNLVQAFYKKGEGKSRSALLDQTPTHLFAITLRAMVIWLTNSDTFEEQVLAMFPSPKIEAVMHILSKEGKATQTATRALWEAALKLINGTEKSLGMTKCEALRFILQARLQYIYPALQG
jgi:hypothetical protein